MCDRLDPGADLAGFSVGSARPGSSKVDAQGLSYVDRSAGQLAETPAALTRSVSDLLADHAAGWRVMKNALARHGRNAGAITAARFILDQI